MLKKAITILLVLCTLFSLLAACAESGNKNNTENEKNTDTSDPNAEDIPETTDILRADLPDNINFNGDTFTFLITGPEYGYGYYETKDIYTAEQTGEPLNDAIYIRNRTIEDRFNINIAEFKSSSVVNTAKNAIAAGDATYDAIITMMYECSTLAQSNLIMNIKELPYVDLEKPWWDRNAEKDISIKNKLYFTACDMNTMIIMGTRLLIFNKKLIGDFLLDNPYDHVKNDTWVFDTYARMVKAVHMDVNGNGENDDEDVYGVIMENHSPYFHSVGFGERLTTNDAEGYPQITFNTERLYTAADKVWDLYFDEDVCRRVEKMKHTSDYTNVYTYARMALFTNDKFLFHISGPGIFHEFRNMESDFGILPMPKLDEQQSRYYHTFDPECVMLSAPVTCDTEKTGIMFEAMAAESRYTIIPAVSETILKRKYVRDNESEFILDIVYESRTFDLCRMFGWGGLNSLMDSLTANKKRNLASEMAKINDKVQAAINKTLEAFE